MTSWILDSVNQDLVKQAHTEASRRLLKNALGLVKERQEDANLFFIAHTLELAVIDLLDNEDEVNSLRKVSASAFQLFRVLPRPESPLEAAKADRKSVV